MDDVDVLVVDAGPVGLLLGTELMRDGIAVSVIDKMPSRGFFCKALGITPRTLEIFDDLGIVDRAIDAGLWLTGVQTWVDAAKVPARSMCMPEAVCRTARCRSRKTKRSGCSKRRSRSMAGA
ncbi:FAD-dependent monooxygenase [Paraburkholderia bengalensis]|uniref:FAD-dependent monooxygenase n=1 Tax=Paraburkholderia bengalensis TaxID=2747562 RepID=UPI0030148BD1